MVVSDCKMPKNAGKDFQSVRIVFETYPLHSTLDYYNFNFLFIKAYVARNIHIHDLTCNDTSLFTVIHNELYFCQTFQLQPSNLL